MWNVMMIKILYLKEIMVLVKIRFDIRTSKVINFILGRIFQLIHLNSFNYSFQLKNSRMKIFIKIFNLLLIKNLTIGTFQLWFLFNFWKLWSEICSAISSCFLLNENKLSSEFIILVKKKKRNFQPLSINRSS